MAEHLIRAGFPNIESLRGKSPDDIYAADCIAQGMPVDKCALYCYRLAVHYADHDGQLPEGITNMMLTKSLKELVEHNLIISIQYETIPPKVEYALTERGKSLLPALKELSEWGEEQLKLDNFK